MLAGAASAGLVGGADPGRRTSSSGGDADRRRVKTHFQFPKLSDGPLRGFTLLLIEQFFEFRRSEERLLIRAQ